MDDLKNLWIGAIGSLLAMGIVWIFNHGRRRAKLLAKTKADANAEWKRRAASGIKGDGFSALFHLHRALHVRLLSLGWLLAGALCVIMSGICSHWPWVAVAFMICLQYCTFRFSYFAAQAAAMVEVAEEAVSQVSDEGKEKAVEK